MTVRIALAGDTMLGRGVAETLADRPAEALVAPEVAALIHSADLFVLNLECCISDRGERWPDPYKPFFFRAPPKAVELLTHLGVDCVTLANNHALDYGYDALGDTFRHLQDAGVTYVGAGNDLAEARRPVVIDAAGSRVGIVGFTDHPEEYAAAPGRPGVAYADLRTRFPEWIEDTIGALDADVKVVSPHWGPNMTAEPVPWVRATAPRLVEATATLVAGHSAHVFHGVEQAVIYDLGDFLDDYAVDPVRRNDLGLLWFVEAEAGAVRRIEAVPLTLEFCYTRLATGDDEAWIRRRFIEACAAMGTDVDGSGDRLVVDL